jgi:hypothetical protein
MRRVLVTAAALACMLAVSAGCGEDEEPDPAVETKTIEITFSDGTVTPNGERVEVKRGQRIELVVKAETEGEIHVHSSPEQEFTYSEGTTTLPLKIDKAGVVDVESHDLEQVIVQLQVE